MDLRARKRFIIRTVWLTIPAPIVVGWLAFRYMPAAHGLDMSGERLAFAARWLVVAMIPYVASCLSIAGFRFFEGAHDPMKDVASPRIQILCRVMQNTLEQLVWFGIALFAFAGMATPWQARIIPIACALFALARFVYWIGYTRSGTLGRAPGVQLTFSLNIHMLVAVALLMARA
jgi:uncharacterized membrane protein YecN with MAPEG domain